MKAFWKEKYAKEQQEQSSAGAPQAEVGDPPSFGMIMHLWLAQPGNCLFHSP